MPFKQIKVKGGYKNKNMRTGKLHSNKPMTKEKADSQLRILKMTKQANKGRMPNVDIK
jgi:hypothetical protein|tara:strand:- start:511 stop:684 length:174 start_codon:yes stop_codon:yes gene_type:complete